MTMNGVRLACAGSSRPLVLGLDIAGQPLAWLDWMQAASMYCRGLVVWTAGEHVTAVFGGINRLTGQRSRLELNSIVALRGRWSRPTRDVPPLCNANLFARDKHHCLYCGKTFSARGLSRDHVVPRSKGGRNTWANVATACMYCNCRKSNRTPEEAGMPLLAVPFVPSRSEHLILSNRKILGDQMRFLAAHMPADRRAHYGIAN